VRRALLVAAGLTLLALAPAAGAQTPIAGAGSFNDAPVLEPGRYTDTLRGGEQLFYAVSLKPGQRLTAGATVSGRTDTSYFITLQIYSPIREEDVFDGEQRDTFGQNDRSKSLRVEGQRVGEDDGGVADSVYADPGTYYVSLSAFDVGRNLEADQFDTEIDLQVTGEVIEEPTPTATAEPADEVDAPDESTAGLDGGAGDGGGGELGMAIVFGLALGGLLGFGARRLRSPA
jgi:hypothetical protein